LTKFYTATELGERQVLGSTSPLPQHTEVRSTNQFAQDTRSHHLKLGCMKSCIKLRQFSQRVKRLFQQRDSVCAPDCPVAFCRCCLFQRINRAPLTVLWLMTA